MKKISYIDLTDVTGDNPVDIIMKYIVIINVKINEMITEMNDK